MGLQINASGILAALLRQRVTANNIANVNTPGYRAARADLTSGPDGGVRLGSVTRSEALGPLQYTGRPTDLAAADAFFQVERPDGGTAYTRAGRFGLNADGEVVTASGERLSPPVQVPENATGVTVNRQGQVFATVPGSLEPRQVGQVEVFTFSNPGGLEAEGNGLFTATTASGPARPAAESVEVLGGVLEGSNVDLATEQVNTLLNVRTFEANVNAFKVQDDILGTLLDLRD
jgi:flagellar basal-body rod protein FlgG